MHLSVRRNDAWSSAVGDRQRFFLTVSVTPIAENNTSFLVKFSGRVFLAMSSESTFRDNSDEVTIFRFFPEFG